MPCCSSNLAHIVPCIRAGWICGMKMPQTRKMSYLSSVHCRTHQPLMLLRSSKANSYHVSAGQEFWLACWNKWLPLKSSAQRAQDCWGQHGTAWEPSTHCCDVKHKRVRRKSYIVTLLLYGEHLISPCRDKKMQNYTDREAFQQWPLVSGLAAAELNDFCNTRSIWSQANYTMLLIQEKNSVDEPLSNDTGRAETIEIPFWFRGTFLSASLDKTAPDEALLSARRDASLAGWDLMETGRTCRVSGWTLQSRKDNPDKAKQQVCRWAVLLPCFEGHYPGVFKAQRLAARFWFSSHFLYMKDTLHHSVVLTMMCSWKIIEIHHSKVKTWE